MKYFGPFCVILFGFPYFTSPAQLLDDALRTAKKENKFVMIVVESDKCLQCNDVVNQGLSSEVAKRAINAS